MELHSVIGVLSILKESIQLIPKNGKLMMLIVTLHIILSSALYFLMSFLNKILMKDMLVLQFQAIVPSTTTTTPNSFKSPLDAMKKDLHLLILMNLGFSIVSFLVTLLSSISVIAVSAVSYTGKSFSINDLCLMIKKSWRKSLVTSFYTTLLGFGYVFFCFAMFASFLIFPDFSIFKNPIFLAVLALLSSLYLYLMVNWMLAIVISVIEEPSCYGIEAIGKSGRLIKGNKLQGLILNMCFSVLGLIVFGVVKVIKGDKWQTNVTLAMLLSIVFSSIVVMFQSVTSTVLYFHCKKNHGEDVELEGSFKYSQLSTLPIMFKDSFDPVKV